MNRILIRTLTLWLCSLLLAASPALAAKKVKVKVSGSGKSVLAQFGEQTKRSTGNSATISAPSGLNKVRLSVLSADGSYEAPAVAAIKVGKKYYKWASAKKAGICKKAGAVAVMGVKLKSGTLNLGKLGKSGSNTYYVKSSVSKSNLVTAATADVSGNCQLSASVGTTSFVKARLQKKSKLGVKVGDADDTDGDGRTDEVDADDDGDGIRDNYEETVTAAGENEVRIFSNLKLDLQNTVNVAAFRNASQSEADIATAIDTAMSGTTSLAIAIAGDSGETTELNCGALSYCSANGTGNEGTFPGAVGDPTYDPDSDGFGTIEAGGTGDFQLRTGATSSEIHSGDVFTETVTDSASNVTEYSGILNFTFNTNPAALQLQVGTDTPIVVSYPVASGASGTNSNPIIVPLSDPVSVTFTMLRPERKADSAAGETDYQAIGLSSINIDLPNAPANGGGGSPGVGACVKGYSTSDTNLTLNTDSGTGEQELKDNLSDQNTDYSNTVTFTINLSECLANPRSGGTPLSWGADETLTVDVQFKNNYGDNAAQKFYFKKATS